VEYRRSYIKGLIGVKQKLNAAVKQEFKAIDGQTESNKSFKTFDGQSKSNKSLKPLMYSQSQTEA